MPSYYQYGERDPSALNDPNAPPTGQWENTDDWPRTYTYLPPNQAYQGYHPPAPVYHSTQPGMQYYNPGGTMSAQAPYYANGYYYNAPQAPAPGWPCSLSSPLFSSTPYTCYPVSSSQPTWPTPYSNPYLSLFPPAYPQFPYSAHNQYQNWGTLLGASAAAAAANAALSASANAPAYFVGATKAEVDMQNAWIAHNTGATTPSQLAPYKPAAGQQFWCKETDGSWTLRAHSEGTMADVAPGHWEKHATSGYFYWVRH